MPDQPIPTPKPDNTPLAVEKAFERILWGTRLIVIVPVIASVVMAIAAMAFATMDAVRVVLHVVSSMSVTAGESEKAHTQVVTTMVRAIDGYLLAAIMIIFAMGLYELFISKIDIAEENCEVANRMLLIHSLDDLKDRLGKVVVLILAITFFQRALELDWNTPVELLWLGLGTLLIGGALYLSGRHNPPPG